MAPIPETRETSGQHASDPIAQPSVQQSADPIPPRVPSPAATAAKEPEIQPSVSASVPQPDSTQGGTSTSIQSLTEQILALIEKKNEERDRRKAEEKAEKKKRKAEEREQAEAAKRAKRDEKRALEEARLKFEQERLAREEERERKREERERKRDEEMRQDRERREAHDRMQQEIMMKTVELLASFSAQRPPTLTAPAVQPSVALALPIQARHGGSSQTGTTDSATPSDPTEPSQSAPGDDKEKEASDKTAD